MTTIYSRRDGQGKKSEAVRISILLDKNSPAYKELVRLARKDGLTIQTLAENVIKAALKPEQKDGKGSKS